jgi:hypothetical protein
MHLADKYRRQYMKVGEILEGLARSRDEKTERDNEYRQYLYQHIDGVQRNYTEYFLPLLNLSDEELEEKIRECDGEDIISVNSLKDGIVRAGSSIPKHDRSKWSDQEFPYYRIHFYPTFQEKNASKEDKKKFDEDYENAWIHHRYNNPHHPGYWYNDEDEPVNMPVSTIIEMICDWMSMSDYFGSSTVDWWHSDESSEEHSEMTEHTIDTVEVLLKAIGAG